MHSQCQMKNALPQSWLVTKEMNYFAQFSCLGHNSLWLYKLVRGNTFKLKLCNSFNNIMLWCHEGSQLLFLYISTDKISFPENLVDSFQQGLLSNMEPISENTIKTDNLCVSQGLPKPHALNEESKQPQFAVNSRSHNRAAETTMTKSLTQKFIQKFKIPETPLLDNISQTCKLGNSFIPGTPQCHQKRRGLFCSTVPETHLFSKTPTAQMNNKEKPIRLRWVSSCGKTPDFEQIVPETPKLSLKSTNVSSLYD